MKIEKVGNVINVKLATADGTKCIRDRISSALEKEGFILQTEYDGIRLFDKIKDKGD